MMAVDMWGKRDHEAEWNRWMSWLNHIATRVSAVDGVKTSIVQPVGLSNRTPSLVIGWDRTRLGIRGSTVARLLLETEPRIATPGGREAEGSTETSISITPYQMSPGEAKVVADRLYALLSNPPQRDSDTAADPSVDVKGQWDVCIEYAAGNSHHTLHLNQQGSRIEGTHQGDFVSRDLTGRVEGDTVRMRSAYTEERGDSLVFNFSGRLSGDEMSGTLDMGEYLLGKWTARRHRYPAPD